MSAPLNTRRLAVVSAGLSQPSSTRLLAGRLAAATRDALADLGVDTGVDVIELRDYATEIGNSLLTGFPSTKLRPVVETVAEADGLIATTPIFLASYSGLFKSFFDTLEPDLLVGKPVLIGATGGTERHSLALEHALRPMFVYLKSIVVPTAVYAASSDWGSSAEGARALDQRIARAAGELADLVSKDRAPRRDDPFADPTPFAELLGGTGEDT